MPAFDQTAVRFNCEVRRSIDDSGLITNVTEAFRECGWFDLRRVKQHFDTLVKRPRTNLPHALQRGEQARDALFAFLTVKPLLAGNFERDGFEHR
ncbi:hypothetical protein CF70_002620 [Cupriavidus sp. SK-3]|nr:hypothetical protein CF70_002620 [Cupriavidus sp. SK-3]